MRRVWRENGLSICLTLLFLSTWGGQVLVGQRDFNEEQRAHAQPTLSMPAYLRSPEFLEATAENWESEFLQMGLYVVLTTALFQRGSAESKDPDKASPQDREPDTQRTGAPAIVRRGGTALRWYRHSLSITLFSLFFLSFLMHAVGGAGAFNRDAAAHGSSETVTTWSYFATSRFWFESLQNWQSECLSMLAIVVLSIWLREHGSPESKPVDAGHRDTGSA